jgi:VWFA-related protein
MRNIGCALMLLFAAAFALPGQEQTGTPTFRSTTTLVQFTIVAVDHKGQPVTDLKQDEISISEDGQRRSLAVFRFEGGETGAGNAAEPAARMALPPGIFTNRPEYSPGPPRNLTAIVLHGGGPLVRSLVTKYLRTIEPGTRIAVYRHAGTSMRILHDFSEDVDSLRRRIATADIGTVETQSARSWDFGPVAASGGSQSMSAQRAAMNEMEARAMADYGQSVYQSHAADPLMALEALGNHLAAIPGRKNLVWISAGLQIDTGWGVGITDPLSTGRNSLLMDRIRVTAQRLASQGITMYPVYSIGLDPPPAGYGPAASGLWNHSEFRAADPHQYQAAARPDGPVAHPRVVGGYYRRPVLEEHQRSYSGHRCSGQRSARLLLDRILLERGTGQSLARPQSKSKPPRSQPDPPARLSRHRARRAARRLVRAGVAHGGHESARVDGHPPRRQA